MNLKMNQTKQLLEAVIKGLQEKKGKRIRVVDLTKLSGAICEYMVIGEGTNPNQLHALSDSVWNIARVSVNEKPISVDGDRNSPWIGLDYGTVLVHLFLPEQRAFYDLEHLWADSKITEIPDLD